MRFCDFFSGIGGFRLGLERAGHKGVWACEIDDFCRKIYTRHFEEPQAKDIADVKAEEIPEAELWCGGFPCQDLSVAGKRGGLKARRSGLYWTWHRLIEARRPPWLLIENVPGLLTSPPNQPGADFGFLLSSLDKIGYGLSWRVLDAQFFGLAQRRKRVFIVGRFGEPCPSEILFECDDGKRGVAQEQKAGSEIANAVRTRVDKGDATKSTYIVGTLPSGGGGNRGWFVSAEDARDGRVVIAPAPHADGVRKASRIRRRIHTPDSHRYKALGNAVAVPVIEWIGRRLPK